MIRIRIDPFVRAALHIENSFWVMKNDGKNAVGGGLRINGAQVLRCGTRNLCTFTFRAWLARTATCVQLRDLLIVFS